MRDPKSPATVADILATRYYIDALAQTLIETKALKKEDLLVRLTRDRPSQPAEVQAEIDEIAATANGWNRRV
jgi:hypothetical protein